MKILILDDDHGRLEIFRRHLTGHYLVVTETAADCISALRVGGRFDLAFLDHDLGGRIMLPSGPGTGYEVAKWLEAHPECMPEYVVIHTFNPAGAEAMRAALPMALAYPGAWSAADSLVRDFMKAKNLNKETT